MIVFAGCLTSRLFRNGPPAPDTALWLEDGFQRLAMDQGQPLSPELLEALLSMACIGALGFFVFDKSGLEETWFFFKRKKIMSHDFVKWNIETWKAASKSLDVLWDSEIAC